MTAANRYESQIKALDANHRATGNELNKASSALRELQQRPPKTFWAEALDGLMENTGCLVVLLALSAVLMLAAYLIASWIWP